MWLGFVSWPGPGSQSFCMVSGNKVEDWGLEGRLSRMIQSLNQVSLHSLCPPKNGCVRECVYMCARKRRNRASDLYRFKANGVEMVQYTVFCENQTLPIKDASQ